MNGRDGGEVLFDCPSCGTPNTTTQHRLSPHPIRQAVERDAQIRHFIHVLSHRLNLLDWDIRYNPTLKPDPDHTAEIVYSPSDKAAVIVIADSVPDRDLEALVAHELLHATLKPLVDQAERLLVHVDGDRSRVHLHEMFDDAEEVVIETLTRALVQSAPRLVVAGPEGQLDTWAPFAR